MKIYLFAAAVCLIAFMMLSKFEDRPWLRALDFSVTVKVQDRISRACGSRCDSLFEDIGFFASPMVSVVAVVLFSGMIFLRVRGLKKKSAVLLIPLMFGVLTLAELYGKSVVHHPAPPFFMLKNPTTLFPKYYINELFTYPSGHAARAVFLAILVLVTVQRCANGAMKKRLWLRLCVGVYVGLVSLSRIYLGHHWFSDVLGGMFLGGGLGLLSIRFL